MIDFEPKYITFDCHGTLIRFRMADMTRELYGAEVYAARPESLVHFFAGYRRDEVLGAWKPYRDVVVNAFRRACKHVGVPFEDQLDCNPEDVLHVSSSPRYDLMTARDMGIRHKAFGNRGHDTSRPRPITSTMRSTTSRAWRRCPGFEGGPHTIASSGAAG